METQSKNEEISEWKTHINTQKLHWNFSTITNVFLDQKRVTICENIHFVIDKSFSEASACLCLHFIQRSLHFSVSVSSFFSYFCIFQSLLDKAQRMYGIDLVPSNIPMYYEITLTNAIREVFPQCKLAGYLLNFKQILWFKIRSRMMDRHFTFQKNKWGYELNSTLQ